MTLSQRTSKITLSLLFIVGAAAAVSVGACGESSSNGGNDGDGGRGGSGASAPAGGGGESSAKGGGGADSASGGAGGNGGEGGSTPVCGQAAQGVVNNVTAFCEATAKAFCGAYFSCCEEPIGDLGATAADCEENFPTLCAEEIMNETAVAVGLGQAILDTDRLGQCLCGLEALKDEAPGCTRAPLDIFAIDCIGSFVGQLEPGDDCTAADPITVACPNAMCGDDGTCLKPGEKGDICSDALEGCDLTKNLFCSVTTKTCQPPGKIGDDCTGNGDTPILSAECLSFSCGANDKCIAPAAKGLCSSVLF